MALVFRSSMTRVGAVLANRRLCRCPAFSRHRFFLHFSLAMSGSSYTSPSLSMACSTLHVNNKGQPIHNKMQHQCHPGTSGLQFTMTEKYVIPDIMLCRYHYRRKTPALMELRYGSVCGRVRSGYRNQHQRD